MLKIAVPNKGSLSEGATTLIQKAGYKCKRSSKELYCADEDNGIEFYFLRPTDIPTYVEAGIFHFGITGRDIMANTGLALEERMALNFGRARMMFITPGDYDYKGLQDFEGKRIACSYPGLITSYLADNGISSKIVKLNGAVEISLHLGIADFAADVVETGTTIRQAGLKTVGDPIIRSEAIIIQASGSNDCNTADLFIKRITGIIVARQYAMIEYDIPTEKLKQACKIYSGIESPTVSTLQEENWNAVKVMVKNSEINKVIDGLSELGAKGIIVTEIKTCRI